MEKYYKNEMIWNETAGKKRNEIARMPVERIWRATMVMAMIIIKSTNSKGERGREKKKYPIEFMIVLADHNTNNNNNR